MEDLHSLNKVETLRVGNWIPKNGPRELLTNEADQMIETRMMTSLDLSYERNSETPQKYFFY